MPTTLQLYRNLITDHETPWCWACGRGGEWWDKPADWFADWWIERSHIVHCPRIIDRRLVVLLCSLCHQSGFHRRRVVTKERPLNWPMLIVDHLLWLKKTFDPEYYDREFIKQFSVQRLPRAVKPPACYLREYASRRAA